MSLLWASLPAIVIAFVSARAPSAQQPQATIKTEVALVNVVFSALDRQNRPVPGLSAEDFIVFEDRTPQTIQYFSEASKETAVPLTIALLLDTSGSIKEKLAYEKEAAAQFLRSVLRKDRDLALLMQFDSEVTLVHDFTHDSETLIAAMGPLRAAYSTSLYDAIFLAVDEKLKTETGRKVIVVITDGDDTSSKVRSETAIETAQRHDVLIYGIGIRGDFGAKFRVLKRFAEETGGRFFSPRATVADMQAAFRAVQEELQSQYSLAYTSTNPRRDSAFRAIDLRCKRSGVRVRARKGYYAPALRPSA